ncbi:hypothetical protein MUU75_08160 [Pseudoxanthomonas mexicana]|uniref:hypothetical protein n=2 Tax=Pseudoxanthomonas TaxID=83618 RepID=UPI001FD689CE|nr:hypothetical protein [Pseudoxanthomonas mexicana]UOV06581.1 hypothetical protein MUU75_08160 [Pseudoxanthomonas mexicana]
MSGYAFSQSAVAFFFILSVWSLFRVDPLRPLTVIPHAILVGLQFWIHPTGAVAPIASLLALALVVAPRPYRLLMLHAVVSLGLVAAYRYGVEPWRVAGMTPGGGDPGLHYPGLGKVAAVVLDVSAWTKLLGSALGQLSYNVIASFGVSVLGAIEILRRWRQRHLASADATATHVPTEVVGIFVLLAPLGCIALTALSTATGTPDRLDHWVYGRYQDAFVLPLLALGLLSQRRRWVMVGVAILVCVVGIWLSHGVGASGGINRVNISGLWPELFLREGPVSRWLALGAMGVIAFNLLPRYLAWSGALALYCFAATSQIDWHRAILETRSRPSEVVEFVRGNYADGCVYFDMASLPRDMNPASAQVERGFLYSFFFFNYRYEKGKEAESWANGPCRGALLTYNAGWKQRHPELSVVGIESDTGLRVFVKEAPAQLRYPVARASASSGSQWRPRMGETCLLSGGCLNSSPGDLARFTRVGKLGETGLLTTGREGYLFFGPYRPLPAGIYELRLRGRANTLEAAYLDVVSDGGRRVLMKEALIARSPDSLGAWRFEVPSDQASVEVRLWVGAGDDLTVAGYSLQPAVAGL